MKIARVTGEAVTTIKHATLEGKSLLLVQPLTPEGKEEGVPEIAVDTVGAGIGERVLVTQEGRAAEELTGHENPPVRTLIVGIIDSIEWGGETVFAKDES
ncbi:MAG: EutN/CcmL family microcompartment protein [Gemmatimonadetes bacterium]|nr:EutN/CcmL family microcompartment protein [Gemmatimonadota bacterium]